MMARIRTALLVLGVAGLISETSVAGTRRPCALVKRILTTLLLRQITASSSESGSRTATAGAHRRRCAPV